MSTSNAPAKPGKTPPLTFTYKDFIDMYGACMLRANILGGFIPVEGDKAEQRAKQLVGIGYAILNWIAIEQGLMPFAAPGEDAREHVTKFQQAVETLIDFDEDTILGEGAYINVLQLWRMLKGQPMEAHEGDEVVGPDAPAQSEPPAVTDPGPAVGC